MPIEFQPLRLVSAINSVAGPARVWAEQAPAKAMTDIEVSLSALLGTKSAPPIDHERIVALRDTVTGQVDEQNAAIAALLGSLN